jgi:hypothetical protein
MPTLVLAFSIRCVHRKKTRENSGTVWNCPELLGYSGGCDPSPENALIFGNHLEPFGFFAVSQGSRLGGRRRCKSPIKSVIGTPRAGCGPPNQRAKGVLGITTKVLLKPPQTTILPTNHCKYVIIKILVGFTRLHAKRFKKGLFTNDRLNPCFTTSLSTEFRYQGRKCFWEPSFVFPPSRIFFTVHWLVLCWMARCRILALCSLCEVQICMTSS